MTNYRQLAGRYLKSNKKRTILTILGVALSTMILFAFLNSVMSMYVEFRNEAREYVKYEAYLLCDNEEVLTQITKEKCIKNFKCISIQDSQSGETYEHVLAVNFKHPYAMKKYIGDLTDKYGVVHQYTDLAVFYFAEDGSSVMIVALTMLLIAYIFAVFSVAVVRNSIQLISLEQIRDYGILRCMGSTKKQLKEVVFWIAFLLEMNGIAVGILLGFLLYLGIAIKAEFEIGFYFGVIPFILVCYLFDLYFVVQENCKFVNRLTPVAAVRGEFKINKSKLKARGKSVAGLIWGIEGDYAMKNLKRNPARMWKTIGIMAMGIAMVTISVSVCGVIQGYVTGDAKQYGKYQISNFYIWEPGVGNIRGKEVFLEEEYKELLRNSRSVTAYKECYEARIFTKDILEVYNHLDEVYRQEAAWGIALNSVKERGGDKAAEERLKVSANMILGGNRLLGYDEEDYRDLQKYLQAGTLDLSEDGILLVNQVCTQDYHVETLNPVWKDYQITNYQLGDTIEVVDFREMDALIKERLEEAGYSNLEKAYEENGAEVQSICYACYRELAETGVTKTYTIEGILEKDVNRASPNYEEVCFILPLEKYFEETGLTEEQSSGQMYHIQGFQLEQELEDMYYDTLSYADLEYLGVLFSLRAMWNGVLAVMLFTLFVFVVNMLNMINTTASDLYLRRREFAQLRVLGMSKRKLTFTVMLESIIIVIVSGVIGVTAAFAAVKGAVKFINLGFYVEFEFSWLGCLAMLGACTLLVCLSVYLPIKNMKINMAEELLASGE